MRRPGATAAAGSTLLALLCACSGGSEGSRPAADQPSGGASSSASVVVKGYAFPEIIASPGAQLRLEDGDGEPHTVTAVDRSFDSGTFSSDKPGRLTAPAKPGRYEIVCTIHPSMKGTLVVR